jgi:hypothetical protein
MSVANAASCWPITTFPGNRFGVAKRLAPVGLMPPAAFAVHQLRYWLAFHGGAGLELQRQGHSYLHSLVPWLVTVLALALGAFLVSLGRALAGQRTVARYTISFAGLWVLCAFSLVAIYVAQECLEGLFAIGHPSGLVGIFGHGGWWAIPTSTCVGLVLAAIFHGARWVLDEVFERRARDRTAPLRPTFRVRLPVDARVPRLAPLADGWSGRGPPR